MEYMGSSYDLGELHIYIYIYMGIFFMILGNSIHRCIYIYIEGSFL